MSQVGKHDTIDLDTIMNQSITSGMPHGLSVHDLLLLSNGRMVDKARGMTNLI